MKSNLRKKQLQKILSQDGSLGASELAKLLNTSIPTVYKYLKILKQEYLINLSTNNDNLIYFELTGSYFLKRFYENSILKQAIALEAVKLINDHDTIAIDASTTCFFLCREIKNARKKVNIITNSILIPLELFNCPDITVISTGGIVGNEIASFVKRPLEDILNNIVIKKFFQSCFAISDELGILDEIGRDDIEVRKVFLSLAQENILLTDSTKFSKNGSYNWVSLNKLNTIVTDYNLDKKTIEKIKNKGVNVIVADEGGD